jgi:hypothetical protein
MAQKKKRGEGHPADAYPCPVCGGTEFTWGKTYGYAGASFVFKPESSRWYQSGRRTEARECSQCGNVLLFTR